MTQQGDTLPSSTNTIYARVPGYLKDTLDEWAATHGMTLSGAVRHLLEFALAGHPGSGETPAEARYVMALQIIGRGTCSLCERGETARLALRRP